jgi:predicted dinucleotide-binding enzyme
MQIGIIGNREHLRDRAGDGIALFLAGDDQDAKDRVAALISDIDFAPVDVGSLAEGGREVQPGAPFSGVLLSEAEARAQV